MRTILLVTLAFVVQQQGIVNYAKIAVPRWFQLKTKTTSFIVSSHVIVILYKHIDVVHLNSI